LVGLEGSVFLMERRSVGVGFASQPNGDPVIARPFIDTLTGQGGRTVTSAPDNFAGALTATTSSRLWGAEINATKAVFGCMSHDGNIEFDLLAGIRYLDLEEGLSISQNSTVLPDGVAAFQGQFLLAPTNVLVADSFTTRNQFFGGQVGTAFEFQYCHFFVYTVAKVGLGVVHQVLNVNGNSIAIVPGGGILSAPGGVLALPSNIGRRAHDDFAAVPEVNLNLGYQFTPRLRAFIGYTFLYWSEVERPGNQTDLVVSGGQIPTSPAFGQISNPLLPSPQIRRTDFWAQGFNCGLAFHF
jgi:hypothetical protein